MFYDGVSWILIRCEKDETQTVDTLAAASLLTCKVCYSSLAITLSAATHTDLGLYCAGLQALLHAQVDTLVTRMGLAASLKGSPIVASSVSFCCFFSLLLWHLQRLRY